MVRTAFSLIGLVLCTFFCAAITRAQEIGPRSYLFVEVADAKGEVVVDATVRVSTAAGKELVNVRTSMTGTVEAKFDSSPGVPHYDLQITKSGYVPYESVLFPDVPNDHYFAVSTLIEQIPNTVRPASDRNSRTVKITLRETPATPAEAKEQLLLLAVKRGDAGSLGKLLQEGVDANSADAKGIPAVAWATFGGDPETIKLLLDAGANVRKREALLIYLTEGVVRGRLQTEIIERLIAAGADVNASNSYHGTVLNKAIVQVPSALTIETIRTLIKAGADVNTADATGQTPLMFAARQNQPELLDLLLNSGAKRSLNAKDKDGRSAFIYAASGFRDSSLAIVKVLMANGAMVTEVDEAGETPLMLAAKGASIETIKILLQAGASINAKDKQGQTALMYVVTGYNIQNPDIPQAIKLLLANGAGINDVDAKGQSALMHVAPVSSDPELIKLLTANGASVNVVDSDGQTALLLAVQRYSSIGIVQALLQAGAGSIINAKDSKGRSALLNAVEYIREDIAGALLAAGASVDIANESGETALIMAVQRIQLGLVKLLLKAGASINIKDHQGNTALMYAKYSYLGSAEVFDVLIAAGAGVNDVNEIGETPLIRSAAEKGNVVAVRKLLTTDAKTSIEARTKRGETALMYAAMYSDPEVVAALLAAGANVNATNDKGEPVLTLAIKGYAYGPPRIEIVKLLLQSGADVNIKDKAGQTPLTLARKLGDTAIVKLIEESSH